MSNTPPDARGPARHGRTTLRIVDLLRPHWKSLTLALLAVIVETIADVLEPWPVKFVVDNILQSKPLPGLAGRLAAAVFGDGPHAALNFAVAAVAGLAAVGAISSYYEKHLTNLVSQWVAHDLRRTIYHHIQRLSLAQHDEAKTGDMVTRVTSDIAVVQEFIGYAMLGLLLNLMTLAGMIAVMVTVDLGFTLIALTVIPPLVFVVYRFTGRLKSASRDVLDTESDLVSVVEESLGSIRVIKAFAREEYEDRRFNSQSLANVEAGIKVRSLKARLAPTVEVIVAIGTCLVLWYGAHLALSGQLSAGVLIVFLLYLGKMYKPLRDLSKMTDSVSRAAVSAERIQEVLKTERLVRDTPGARRAPKLTGEIAFKDVSFGYEPEQLLIKDVSLKIEAGQFVAFVGPSGSGKSTIVSLIPRFYDPVSGQVLLQGTDIRRYQLKSLRDQMSFVLQDTVLFRTTIWENIAYGKPGASPAEIRRAAELANAQEFIDDMPDGYDTMVGDRGVALSGGQRQRIAIARAVIRDTPILILDEPTSGLDAASEQSVMEALDRLMKARTSVVIAHRLSTISRADVIYVVNGTGLAEQGTHDSLMALDGVYAGLHKLQTSPPDADA